MILSDGTKALWSNSFFVGQPQKFEIKDGTGPFKVIVLLNNARLPNASFTIDGRNISITPQSAGLLAFKIRDKGLNKATRAQFQIRGPSDRIANESLLNFEFLKKFIIDNKISSVEQMLPLLPPEYLKKFTLMHSSASLQGSSYENPRTIIFGEEARFIMTFNGYHAVGRDRDGNPLDHGESRDTRLPTSASRRGFFDFEIVEFNPSTQKFEFHFLSFPRGAEFENLGYAPPAEVESSVASASFSKLNPSTCMACHKGSGNSSAADPTPLWSQYEVWPGAYGAISDTYKASSYSKNSFVNYPFDKQKLNQLIARASEHPRYRNLALGETYARPGQAQQISTEFMRYAEMPNLTLNAKLFNHVYKRVARKLSNQQRVTALRLVGSCTLEEVPEANWNTKKLFTETFFLAGLSERYKDLNTYSLTPELGLISLFPNTRMINRHLPEDIDQAELADVLSKRNFTGLTDPLFALPEISYRMIQRLLAEGVISSADAIGFVTFEGEQGLDAFITLAGADSKDPNDILTKHINGMYRGQAMSGDFGFAVAKDRDPDGDSAVLPPQMCDTLYALQKKLKTE
jgi:hypothetical protein